MIKTHPENYDSEASGTLQVWWVPEALVIMYNQVKVIMTTAIQEDGRIYRATQKEATLKTPIGE